LHTTFSSTNTTLQIPLMVQ